MLFKSDQGLIYILDSSGTVWISGTIIDAGYDPNGSLFFLPSRVGSGLKSLFIAGGIKMRRYIGGVFYTWGIAPPSGAALGVFPYLNAAEILQDCENSAQWSTAFCSVATETGIVHSGASSLAIILTANVPGLVTTITLPGTAAAYLSNISFWFYATTPSDVDLVEVNILYQYNGVTSNKFVEISAPVLASQYTKLVTDDGGIVPAGAIITQLGLTIRSKTNQTVYIDEIDLQPVGQNDANGARYKYSYYNSQTGVRSNLNSLPSPQALGEHNAVFVTGFIAPPAISGADTIILYRDIGGDGVYQLVGQIPVSAIASGFNDLVSTENLGEVDTNINILPPHATVGIEYSHSLWLNDITAPTRVWRSTGGNFESFNSFFDVSTTGDAVVGFVNVRGLLFILSNEHITQVLDPDGETPGFFNVAQVGPVSTRAFYGTRDFVVIGHFSGIYIFDGANLKPLDNINTLFNPLSNDPRRLNETNISTLVVGSESTHVWITYRQLNGAMITWTYHIATGTFVEDSEILVAHEDGDAVFGHISSGQSGEIWDVYQGSSYASMELITPVLELSEWSQALEFCIQSLHASPIDTQIFGEGFTVVTPLPSSPARSNIYTPIGNTYFGKNIQFILQPTTGYVEIYDISFSSTKLNSVVYYDTEPVFLAADRITSLEFNYSYWGVGSGTVTTTFYVDNEPVATYHDDILQYELVNKRHVIPPMTGNLCRVVVNGPLIRVLNLTVSLISLGTKEVERHSLTVLPREQNALARLLQG
jgi:hypothetical protein